jgi:hypothetical protein
MVQGNYAHSVGKFWPTTNDSCRTAASGPALDRSRSNSSLETPEIECEAHDIDCYAPGVRSSESRL